MKTNKLSEFALDRLALGEASAAELDRASLHPDAVNRAVAERLQGFDAFPELQAERLRTHIHRLIKLKSDANPSPPGAFKQLVAAMRRVFSRQA